MTTADPGTLAVRRSGIDVLSASWERAREFYRVLLPIRFSFLTLVVFTVALVSDQGKDAIAALAEGTESWKPVYVNGVRVLFLVVIALFAAQMWYWSRQLLRVQFRGQPDPMAWPTSIKVLPRTLGLLVFGVTMFGLALVRSSYGENVRRPAEILRNLMIALSVEAALFIFFVIIRRKRLGAVTPVNNLKGFGKTTLRILGLTALLALVVLLASTIAVQRVARVGTISVLVIAFGVWVALGGLLVYGGMKARIPILTWLLLFAIAISPLADNHKVRTIDGPMPSRLTADKAFDGWYQRLKAVTPNETKRTVFIVATEGGGIRAAYWTAAVLASLSDTVPGFTDHLFAISGVSGGSLGATTYRALLAEPSAHGALRDRARTALSYDALAPTIAAFTQQDFVQRFLPFGFPDRAKALEQGWELGWKSAVPSERFRQGFLATTSADADRYPSLFLNGTIVETGERAITSNVLIDGRFAGAVDAFAHVGADVPMSSGAHNSARFPYVSPIGTIGGRHIADGGYFENSGAGTAADLVDVIRRHPEAASIRPYVIVIVTRKEEENTTSPARLANELIAPIRTLLATRGAHARAAVADILERIPKDDITVFKLTQHKGERFPLGWLLAARTRDVIDRQMGPESTKNKDNVKTVAAALGVTPGIDQVWRRADAREKQARAEELQ